MDSARADSGRQRGKRRRPPLDRRQPARELANQALGKSSADPSGIGQMILAVEVAQQQCAKTFSRSARFGEAADDELRVVLAFRFDPVQTAAGVIRRLATFADNPFQPGPPGLLEKLHSLADDRLARSQQLALGRQLQTSQPRLALFQSPSAQIGSVEIQQIEDHVHRALVLRIAKGILQQLKIADPAVVQGHNLPIQDRLLDFQPADRFGQCRHLVRPIETVNARLEPHPIAVFECQHSVAIELHFVQPIVPGRRRGDQCRQLRINRTWPGIVLWF